MLFSDSDSSHYSSSPEPTEPCHTDPRQSNFGHDIKLIRLDLERLTQPLRRDPVLSSRVRQHRQSHSITRGIVLYFPA
eukprot:scaffold201257_cov37-Prasinocladus_malaysianus.AAC.1